MKINASGYQDFLSAKRQHGCDDGFEPLWIPDFLFDFQRELVSFALRKGRAAIFADCGLGKSPMSLVWAKNVWRKTERPVLILTPLAVTHQFVSEGEKFGVEIKRADKPEPPITTANYERLHYFDPADFGGVVCDESSILKNFSGKTRRAITEFLRTVPYRLLGTATAAPNDYIEFGTSSEALGELGYMDMLARFFKHDTGSSHPNHGMFSRGNWRFRGYAEGDFWRWVCSWARALRKPSDMGFSDKGFKLPPLVTWQHVVTARVKPDGMLFDLPAHTLEEQRDERRRTVAERCEKAAEIASDADEPVVVWCNLNDEGDLLETLIDGAVQVQGSDSDDKKEEAFRAFETGETRVLVTKPTIAGFGLNWQHCARQTFFPSHSFEQWYQAIRRSWRFGQKRKVRVDVITSEGEARVLANLERKANRRRQDVLRVGRADEQGAGDRPAGRVVRQGGGASVAVLTQKITDRYALYCGDCCEVMPTLPAESVDLSLYSPPFCGLYNYSSSERDLSNARSYAEFFTHYEFVVKEIGRLTKPGRASAVHCMDVPRDGANLGAGLTDFPGDIIRLHERLGFQYCARYHVWKEPLGVRNRTMAKGLSHRQVVEDSTLCDVAMADYLLMFRKLGENKTPVTHPTGLMSYAGSREVPRDLRQWRGHEGKQTENRYSHWIWRQYASAFWDDVRIDRVLPYRESKDPQDERHVHPLQLDVIERCVVLWSNAGEVVLTPFMGVGSEVYGAVSLGRKAVGVELKPTYYRQAEKNLELVETEPEEELLFDKSESLTQEKAAEKLG